MNLTAGVELRFHEMLAMQLGVFYQLEYKDGVLRKDRYFNSGPLGSVGLAPFGMVSVLF